MKRLDGRFLLICSLCGQGIQYWHNGYCASKCFLSSFQPGLRCGRYDGQTFVKPPEVLTRDRLLGTYEVKPALSRLKTTLLGTGGILLLSGSLLFGIIASTADTDGVYGEAATAKHMHVQVMECKLE